MTKTIKHTGNLSVDAGVICVMDLSWAEIVYGIGGKTPRGMYIVVPEGQTHTIFDVDLPNTWNGAVIEPGIRIKTDGGLVYIGDPCYVIKDESWLKFCDEILEGGDEHVRIIDRMGGDGEYEANITMYQE